MTNKKGSSKLNKVLGGDMLKSKAVLKQIPLLLLILAFCLAMVAVRYRVETLTKERDKLQTEIGYLREQRVQMQRQYQEAIRISRMDKELDSLEIGIVDNPPYELKAW